MTKPLSVYVHIPFCTVKCGYCDFNAYAGMDGLKGAYTGALVQEIDSLPEALGSRPIASISFGGGTPGEMEPADIARVLGAVRERFTIVDDAEVSLEANPGTTNGAQLQQLRAAGINRVSFGAQSFEPAELAMLDRIHSPEAIGASVQLARRAGFASVGLDLIYGLPGQLMEGWLRNLQIAIDLGPDHLSTYGLTVEAGTPLATRVASGKVILPDDDLSADFYEAIEAAVHPGGFAQYELSNWARPGHESRHNSVYWTDGDYLGIGAGAHGYLDGERYENVAHPRAYTSALNSASDSAWPVRVKAYRPSRGVAMADFISLGLRLLRVLDSASFESRFECSLGECAGPVIERCLTAGVLEGDLSRFRLTRRGRLLHGEVAAQLLEHLRTVV
jgi:oxygen-independent coproporphyrinogen-3 oxidase